MIFEKSLLVAQSVNDCLQHPSRFIVSLALLTTLSESIGSAASPIKRVEVFTTGAHPITACYRETAQPAQPPDCLIYRIDGIERFQTEWSQGLPKNPEQAKQVVLSRLQSLNPKGAQPLENAARGLVQAMRYGIDRYPAMVFDGETVVYGVTDVRTAIRIYAEWRVGKALP